MTCLWLKRLVWQEDGAAAAMEVAKRSMEMHGAGMYGAQGLSSAMHLPVRHQSAASLSCSPWHQCPAFSAVCVRCHACWMCQLVIVHMLGSPGACHAGSYSSEFHAKVLRIQV